MPASASATMQESNGRKFRVVGTALTRAAAVAEMKAKVALTVGNIISTQVSEPAAAGEAGAPHADGEYSDATLTLKNGPKFVTVHLENIANSYGDGTTGKLDLTNADLIAFAGAYRDGAGNGGYAVDSGEFVK